MGNAMLAPGKQTMTAAWEAQRDPDPMMSPVVGKATLVSHLLSPPADFAAFVQEAAQLELASVMERAGQRFRDGGKFEFECKSDGSFALVGTKAGRMQTPKIYTLAKDTVVWHAIREEMLKKVGSATPAPAKQAKAPTPLAPLPAPDDTHPHLDTLAVALKKIDDDGGATKYDRPDVETPAVKSMVAGADDAKAFWCSGFSMWTLAKSGYAMTDVLRDAKHHAFTYTLIHKDAKAATKARAALTEKQLEGLAEDEWPSTQTLSMRAMVDGHPIALRALKVFLTTRPKDACNLGTFRAEGAYEEALGANGDPIAARGAVTAFEAFGIGGEVDAAERKPGDFAQEFWKVGGVYTGKGHGFQVASVKVRGAAMFGQEGSPVAEGGTAEGWRTDVIYTIDVTTKPELVGKHEVLSERRAEANEYSSRTADADKDAGKDGGIRVTGDVTPADREKTHPGTRAFYGRLSASPWANWKPSQP